MTRFTPAAFAVLLAAATIAQAHEYKVGDIIVDHPMAFETAKTAQTGGGFLTMTNTGPQAETLISVAADFPRVEIHTTEMDGDIARMMKVEGVAIPSGETVIFQPGGLHVMFMGLGGDPFEAGEEIPATLTFKNAGTLEIMFKVEERTADGHGAMNHDEMDHSDH